MELPPEQKEEMLRAEQQAEIYRARELEAMRAKSSGPRMGCRPPVPAIAFGRREHFKADEDQSTGLNNISDWNRELLVNEFIDNVILYTKKYLPEVVPQRIGVGFDPLVHFFRYFANNLDKKYWPYGVEWNDEEHCWMINGDRVKPIQNSLTDETNEQYKVRMEQELKDAEEIFEGDTEEITRLKNLISMIHVHNRGEVKLILLLLSVYSTEADTIDIKYKRARVCGWYQCKSTFFVNFKRVKEFLNISARWLIRELCLWHGYGEATDFADWTKYHDFPRIELD